MNCTIWLYLFVYINIDTDMFIQGSKWIYKKERYSIYPLILEFAFNLVNSGSIEIELTLFQKILPKYLQLLLSINGQKP